MKKLKAVVLAAACVAALSLGAGKVAAQGGRGNFDPAQMRQNMLDGLRDRLEVKDDAEWKVLSEAIGKVFDARQEVMAGSMRGMGMMFRRNRDQGGDNGGGNGGDQGGQRRQRFGGGNPSPETEALQKAIEAKAPADEIKSKLAAVREARKAAEGKLESAQADLKKLVTSRQEATLVLAGLLK